eukprot:scaffold3096_cov403-Prasinococcus_capsulatus_cf.AAC.3
MSTFCSSRFRPAHASGAARSDIVPVATGAVWRRASLARATAAQVTFRKTRTSEASLALPPAP